MKALGMIEVYGYLTAVEALDSALKAANVSLLDVVCVKGGLVSVLVTGDVGATKAAMDASAAAAERVGQIVSVHVIPRPAGDIERMLGDGPRGPQPPAGPKPPDKPVPPPEETAAENNGTAASPEPADLSDALPALAAPEEEELHELEEDAKAPQINPAALTPDALEDMTVVRLRQIARGVGVHMTRKQIRFAKKEELIAEILKICGQEE